jgi:hypothetical protein
VVKFFAPIQNLFLPGGEVTGSMLYAEGHTRTDSQNL